MFLVNPAAGPYRWRELDDDDDDDVSLIVLGAEAVTAANQRLETRYRRYRDNMCSTYTRVRPDCGTRADRDDCGPGP